MRMNIPDGTFVPNDRARAALANPLREGALLCPTGPCIDLELVTSIDNSSAAQYRSEIVGETPPNPLRPPNFDLLEAVHSRRGWQNLAFRLKRGLQIGHPRYAQVWTVEVELEGRGCGSVVVKLFAEALWPLPHDSLLRWRSLEQRLAAEVQAYTSLHPAQGRDIPHCYGAFSFEMPWGDVVTGVVLEDLGPIADPLKKFCEREKVNLKTPEAVHSVMSPSFHHLHRLQALDVGSICPDTTDIFVLQSSGVAHTHYVLVGFSYSKPAEEGRREWAKMDPEFLYENADEQLLENAWRKVLSLELYVRWARYVVEHEPCLIAWDGRQRGASSSEDEDEEVELSDE
ncbi:hypothetical protein JCM10449v2_002908 [Rhodotorula kratochvilovae]